MNPEADPKEAFAYSLNYSLPVVLVSGHIYYKMDQVSIDSGAKASVVLGKSPTV